MVWLGFFLNMVQEVHTFEGTRAIGPSGHAPAPQVPGGKRLVPTLSEIEDNPIIRRRRKSLEDAVNGGGKEITRRVSRGLVLAPLSVPRLRAETSC